VTSDATANTSARSAFVPWPPLRSARNWPIASGGLTDTSLPAGCDKAALSAVRYRYNVGRAHKGCGPVPTAQQTWPRSGTRVHFDDVVVVEVRHGGKGFTRPKVAPAHSHSTLLALRGMLRPMTEPQHPTESTTAAQEPSAAAEPPYRQDRWHRRGRPFRFAAMVVALAGIVFIIAVIFWSGFVLGASSGGHHGHHWNGSRHASMSSLFAPELASEGAITA